jgi:hypothetical protein
MVYQTHSTTHTQSKGNQKKAESLDSRLKARQKSKGMAMGQTAIRDGYGEPCDGKGKRCGMGSDACAQRAQL